MWISLSLSNLEFTQLVDSEDFCLWANREVIRHYFLEYFSALVPSSLSFPSGTLMNEHQLFRYLGRYLMHPSLTLCPFFFPAYCSLFIGLNKFYQSVIRFTGSISCHLHLILVYSMHFLNFNHVSVVWFTYGSFFFITSISLLRCSIFSFVSRNSVLACWSILIAPVCEPLSNNFSIIFNSILVSADFFPFKCVVFLFFGMTNKFYCFLDALAIMLGDSWCYLNLLCYQTVTLLNLV